MCMISVANYRLFIKCSQVKHLGYLGLYLFTIEIVYPFCDIRTRNLNYSLIFPTSKIIIGS